MSDQYTGDQTHTQETIAVVGMAGRFPSAPDLETFWHNLREGIEGITFFSDEELIALGVPESHVKAPNFVKASPILTDIDQFDATFFGYTPSSARLLDPQHRLFLETAWHALEHAAIDPASYPGTIGVFGGTSLSTYLLFNVLRSPDYSDHEHAFEAMVNNDKDFLCTRVAYHFDLRGPSLDVQTGCSTSLVATHLASEALLSFQCDVALAGGVSVNVPQRTGYFYADGDITSPDGHCRAFDAHGQGTLFGSGVGVVVLKRLNDALRDGDTIHAVLLSSAINNDGAQKVGYTAPSVSGQAEVISRALALANISAESVTYVEAHGTGTSLGDPIEIAALTKAFCADTDAKQFCAIGSVKTNIGHLDAAAGIAGLIKTILALKYEEIPPSLHFTTPNPSIDFANSPFYVNTVRRPWPRSSVPRRAGVSSFGIGGTNAHVIVQEAPELSPTTATRRDTRIILLSARSESALDAATRRLYDYLAQHPNADLSDVAYTLQVGRKRFAWRRSFICRDIAEACQILTTGPANAVFTTYQEHADRPLVFMFPGGGAQYINMGLELYTAEPVFREAVDRCAAILLPQLGFDIRQALYPAHRDEQQIEEIKTTSLALPALFTVEYAIAQLLMSWGLAPAAMIGHSLGEYVAACLASVLSLEDALATVVVRGRLFEELPRGSMISVLAPAEEILPLLGDELSFAAINSPFQCVVSGSSEAIEQFATILTARDIDYRQLKINVAAHSHLVEQVLRRFVAWMESITLQSPRIPFISNVTGDWITDEQATDPAYWGRHLRQTVQFQSGVAELLANPDYVFLEIGPGTTLSTLVKAQADRQRAGDILTLLSHPQDALPADSFLLDAIGRMWAAGATLNWSAFYAHEQRRRLPLPNYPFERQRYWIEPHAHAPTPVQATRPSLDDWFYTPSWQQTPPRLFSSHQIPSRSWLVFIDDDELSRHLVELLRASGQTVVCVAVGERFDCQGLSYRIHPARASDYQAMLQMMQQHGLRPDYVVHLWGLYETTDVVMVQRYGYNALIHLARAWQSVKWDEPVSWWVVGQRVYRVESRDSVDPNYAMSVAPCRTIPQEYPQITCYVVDIGAPTGQTVSYLLADIVTAPEERVIAYRGPQRWRQSFVPVVLAEPDPAIWPLPHEGVYLITGGLGNVGLAWATYLAQHYRAKVALVSRSPFPPRQTWAQHLADETAFAGKIRQIQAIEAAGGEVLILAADVASESQLRGVIVQTQQRFGQLRGIIHAAGITGGKAVSVLADFEPTERESQFVPKVYGTYALSRIVPELDLDFVLLVSSTVAIFGGVGLTAYAASNAFLDAFAVSPHARGTRWISMNLDHLVVKTATKVQTTVDQYTLELHESTEVFRRVVTQAPCAHIIVSTADLGARWDRWVVHAGKQNGDQVSSPNRVAGNERPKLDTPYVPPETAHEKLIAEIWQQTLGIDQIGIDDNFFALGGDSLFAVRVMSKLKKALQIDVPVVSLYEGLTVRALAAIVAELEQEQTLHDRSVDQQHQQERHTERQERFQQQRSRRARAVERSI